MVNNVRSLQIGVQSVHCVMESFWLVVKFTTESAHPVDIKFPVAHVKGMRVVEFAKVLPFNESV